MKLYEWQEKAIELARKNPRGIALFAFMGTGKTFCAVNIIRERFTEQHRLMRTLILGPVSVVFNWKRELLRFSKVPEERIFVSSGSSSKRAEKLKKFLEKYPSGIVITNYESLRNKQLFSHLNEWMPEVLVCDESHYVKTHNSMQSKLTFQLSKHSKHVYLLSGTPITNNLMDIFMQFKIMDKGETFGTNFCAFRNTYFKDTNASWNTRMGYFPRWEPIKEMYATMSNLILSKAVRVKQEECLDLPERISKTLEVELSPEQAKAYHAMKRDLVAFVENRKGESKAVVAQLALTKALRLQQIVSGFVMTEEGETIDLGKTPRMELTKELLEQITPEHKVILWCSFRHNYKQLEKVCQDMRLGYCFITGDQSAEEKQESVDQFESDPYKKVMIANRRAGGTGLSLVAASYSIIFSRNFSLVEDEQSQARNYRAGSERHKTIVKIDLCARGTIDELTIKALASKKEMAAIILDEIACI